MTAQTCEAADERYERYERIGVIHIGILDRLVHTLEATIDELRRVDLDDATRDRIIRAHRDLLVEVASDVDDALIDEMLAFGLRPISAASTDDEIRIAHAQLLGWLRGLRAPLVLLVGDEP